MNLSPEQKKAVSEWIAAGASISDVQKRLRDTFNLSLTYIDTRFLIDDLGLDLKNPKPAATRAVDLNTPQAADVAGAGAPPPPGAVSDAELIDDGEAYAAGQDEFADLPEAGASAPGGGAVKVEVDRLTRPGTVVSGSVTFSDGNSGKWALDQYGRLIFEAATPGYRPSQADLQTFQRELSSQLQRHGY